MVRYDDAALAIHGKPARAVELRCCAGAVRKLLNSGPRERAHGAVWSDLAHSMVVVVRYDDVAFAVHGNPFRAAELRSCAGAVRKPFTSGPREHFHVAGLPRGR
jgi:hypothetical protein